jgi:hypothetical protein
MTKKEILIKNLIKPIDFDYIDYENIELSMQEYADQEVKKLLDKVNEDALKDAEWTKYKYGE